jgi:hypothetical protein
MPASFLRVQVQEAGQWVLIGKPRPMLTLLPRPVSLRCGLACLTLCCWWRLQASTWYSTPPALSW